MAVQIFKEYYIWSLLVVAILIDATPPPGHIATPDNDQHPPKYEYGYIVSDQTSTQGHVESRDGIYALGRYHVTLPDGSAQKVTYFADDWGYHPLVSYASSTEHGTSRTEFAMGEAAVAALKQTNSPIANLLSDPAPTQPISTITSAQEQYVNTPTNVQISNAGASGHHDQSYVSQSGSTTVAPPTITTLTSTLSPPVTHLTQAPSTVQELTGTGAVVTTALPTFHAEQTHQQSVQVQGANEQASLEQQSQISEKAQQAAIQAEIQQQQEVQTIQNQLSQHIQETISKLEAHQHLEESKQEAIKQNSLFIPERAEQQIQDIQNSFNYNQQKIANEVSQQNSVSESSFSYNVNQNYAQHIAPTQQIISSYAQQSISVAPTQQLVISQQQESAPLLHEIPNNDNKVEIVTPTSVSYQKPAELYPVLSSNSIAGKNSEDESTYTVDGQNVQITSYLADTNKVFRFGDRIQSKDHQAEQRLIDQVEKHAKLRIFQDLQKNSAINSFTRPIVVTSNPSPTPDISIVTSRPANDVGINTAIYSSGYSTINTQTPATTIENIPQPPPPYAAPLTSNGYIETNSLSHSAAEKSDYSQSHVTINHGGYVYPQHYIPSEHLAHMQAGLTLLSEEKPSAPVNEDNKETKTVVDVQKGIAYDVPSPNQPEVEQYQALGYERRLVDQRAQQVVNEKDPVLQELKAQDLAVRQEIELQQVQQNLQELQKKIVNEIDAQHEEEQRKQEAVANERQKHLDNLQKVADLLQGVQSIPQDHQSYIQQTIPNGQHYEAPQYLPPPPNPPNPPTPPTHQTVYQNFESPVHYHGVSISSLGQNLQSYTHDVKVEDLNYENPPAVVEAQNPVYIENSAAVESSKVVEVENPVVINDPVPNVVEVEKTVPVVQPYPVTVTRVVTVDRPVAVPTPYGVPQPVPLPYAVPHAVGVPIPHLIPYPELYPIAFKQYHPVFIHTKTSSMKPSKRMPEQVFREPKPELFHHSHAYHTIPLHMKGSTHSYPSHKSSYYRHYTKSHPSHSGRNRNSLKNLRIEYGGFKPPLIPSTEFSEEPKPSPYGPSVKGE